MVVFDLDGTLVDTLPDIAAAFNRILLEEGMPTHPVNAYRAFVGWGLKRTLEFVLPDNLPKKKFESMLESVVEAYESSPAKSSKPYPGIWELLRKLAARDVKMAVFTNKAETIAKKVVTTLLPEISFTRIVGGVNERPLKPNPAGLELIKECLQEGDSRILMVGDSQVDCRTALNAGIPFCGVLWGYRDESELRAAGSTDNVKTISELYHRILENEEIQL